MCNGLVSIQSFTPVVVKIMVCVLFYSQPPDSSANEIICLQAPVRTLSAAARCLCIRQHTLIWPCDCLSLCLREAGGSFVRGIRRVEAVDDGVDHDCLLGDGEGAVRRDCNPVVCCDVSTGTAS
jgi:hypothetical protein